MIKPSSLLFACAFVFGSAAAALAQMSAKPSASPPPMPSASETAFISDASNYLENAYPTPADAIKAGYFQYENEDDTGAISYADLQWSSSDAHHPSQLWYDAKGRLIGADFSEPLSSMRPNQWGIDPARWGTFHAHVHYGLIEPDGTTKFAATGGTKFTATGGSIASPTAAQLVAAGIAKTPAEVKFVFAFPAIWDLEIWLIPNPNGAFAEYNPNVKPSQASSGMSM